MFFRYIETFVISDSIWRSQPYRFLSSYQGLLDKVQVSLLYCYYVSLKSKCYQKTYLFAAIVLPVKADYGNLRHIGVSNARPLNWETKTLTTTSHGRYLWYLVIKCPQLVAPYSLSLVLSLLFFPCPTHICWTEPYDWLLFNWNKHVVQKTNTFFWFFSLILV